MGLCNSKRTKFMKYFTKEPHGNFTEVLTEVLVEQPRLYWVCNLDREAQLQSCRMPPRKPGSNVFLNLVDWRLLVEERGRFRLFNGFKCFEFVGKYAGSQWQICLSWKISLLCIVGKIAEEGLWLWLLALLTGDRWQVTYFFFPNFFKDFFHINAFNETMGTYIFNYY